MLKCRPSEVKQKSQVQYQMLGIKRTTRLPFIVALLLRASFTLFTSQHQHHQLRTAVFLPRFWHPGAFKLVLVLCALRLARGHSVGPVAVLRFRRKKW